MGVDVGAAETGYGGHAGLRKQRVLNQLQPVYETHAAFTRSDSHLLPAGYPQNTVGALVEGERVGREVTGDRLGSVEGCAVGLSVGSDGWPVGSLVGDVDGDLVGVFVGLVEGDVVGDWDGPTEVGVLVGRNWHRVVHMQAEYLLQFDCVDTVPHIPDDGNALNCLQFSLLTLSFLCSSQLSFAIADWAKSRNASKTTMKSMMMKGARFIVFIL